ANILVQLGPGGTPQLRVADFGIGGIAARQAVAATREVSRGNFLVTALRGAHTPLYASPQQMRGDPPDPRDDVYSLGVIWYQLLIGEMSTGAPSGLGWFHELRRRGMSDAQIRLLGSCLEARPESRPADCRALTEALKATL